MGMGFKALVLQVGASRVYRADYGSQQSYGHLRSCTVPCVSRASGRDTNSGFRIQGFMCAVSRRKLPSKHPDNTLDRENYQVYL